MDATTDMNVTNSSFVGNAARVGGAIAACATSQTYTCLGDLSLSDVVGRAEINVSR